MTMRIIKIFGCSFLLLLAVQASAQVALRDQLSKAIWKADKTAVRSLLDAGTSAKTLDGEGFASLVSAVMVGSQPGKIAAALDIAQALLDAGANINQEGPVGNTPLTAACSQTNSVEIVEFLISHGANVNQRGYNGTSPLYQAIRKGRTLIAEVLIKNGADVKTKNADGETPLHYAALNGMKSTAELLLAHGAEINARDIEGKTPLSWSRGKIPTKFVGAALPVPVMIELLRQRGASE